MAKHEPTLLPLKPGWPCKRCDIYEHLIFHSPVVENHSNHALILKVEHILPVDLHSQDGHSIHNLPVNEMVKNPINELKELTCYTFKTFSSVFLYSLIIITM